MRQRTKEWLEYRRSRVGASDAPVIMGASPWKTPYQLWLEKLSGKEQEANEAMKKGVEMEEPGRTLFEKMTGLIMVPTMVESKERPWQFASLDGMTYDRDAIVEIKYANKTDHELAHKGQIPAKYWPQLQHQLAVCTLPLGYYFSFNGDEGVIVEVKRNDDYISDLIEREEAFYQCLKQQEAPEFTEKDLKEINHPDWDLYAAQYIEVNKKMKELKKQEERIREYLISLANNQSCKGSGLQICKVVEKGRIDYSSIPEFSHINIDQYRKAPVEKWRFTIQ